MKRLAIYLVFLVAVMAFGQNAQTPPSSTPSATPAPIFAANAKYVQGIGPGYWPTAGTGLVLNLAPGHARCGNVMVNYAGGTLTLANNATNYVYLDTTASCAPASNTTAYTSTGIAVATVTTAGGVITTLFDDRVMGMTNPGGGGGGSGCILPGVNTAVLSEHPVGTCFGNLEFTWDDTNHNAIWGGGAQGLGSDISSSNVFMIGFGQSAEGQYEFLFGDGNNSNLATPSGTQIFHDITAIGDGNAIDGAHDSNLHDIVMIGDGGGFSATGWGAVANGIFVISQGAGIAINGNTSSGGPASTLQDIYMLGGGAVTATTGGSVSDAFLLGNNTVEATGSTNSVNSPMGIGYNDFSSRTGAMQNMGALGISEVYDCSDCYAIGETQVSSYTTNSNDVLAFGVSSNNDLYPSLVVSTGNVRRVATGMSQHQIDHARTSGAGTISGTLGQSCVVNITGGAVGVAFLNGTNSLPSGSNINITTTAYYTSPPSTATLANGTATCSGSINLQTVMMRDPIPACSAGTEGSYAAISDSTTNIQGATITGGGSYHEQGYCNGTNWVVTSGNSAYTIQGGTGANFSVNPEYTFFNNGNGLGPVTTIGTQLTPMSTAQTLDTFYLSGNTSPAAASSATYTITYGTSPGTMATTAITCTLSPGSTTCSDSTHSISVVAGSYLGMQITYTGTPGSITATWSVRAH